jgi:hypothetical protein
MRASWRIAAECDERWDVTARLGTLFAAAQPEIQEIEGPNTKRRNADFFRLSLK